MHYTIDHELDRTFAADYVRKAVLSLEARDAKIITLFYGLDGQVPLTFEQIGKQFGITRERTRQLRDRAVKRLREGTVKLDMVA